MKHIFRTVILSVLFFASAVIPLFADIDGFAGDSEGGSAVSKNTDSGSSGTVHGDKVFDELLQTLWAWNAFAVRYDIYPYARQYCTNYFSFTGQGRMARGSVSGEAVYSSELGSGYRSRIEGQFMPFFAFCENSRLWDTTGNIGNIQLGGGIALLQFNLLSLYINAAWSHWYGSLEKNTGSYGIIVRSYPFKPLAVEWRFNFQDFYNNRTYCESALEAGIMFRRFELYGDWNYTELLHRISSENSETLSKSNGFSAGVRMYF